MKAPRQKETNFFLDWSQHFSSSSDMTRLPLKHSPRESAWLVKTPRGKRQIKDERQYRFLPSFFPSCPYVTAAKYHMDKEGEDVLLRMKHGL